jgi:hypothetical protein
MSNTACFTVQYFNQELVNFRKLMGDKTFWQKPERIRTKAIQALTYVYLNLEHDTPQIECDKCGETLMHTLDEYALRETFLIRARVVG